MSDEPRDTACVMAVLCISRGLTVTMTSLHQDNGWNDSLVLRLVSIQIPPSCPGWKGILLFLDPRFSRESCKAPRSLINLDSRGSFRLLWHLKLFYRIDNIYRAFLNLCFRFLGSLVWLGGWDGNTKQGHVLVQHTRGAWHILPPLCPLMLPLTVVTGQGSLPGFCVVKYIFPLCSR